MNKMEKIYAWKHFSKNLFVLSLILTHYKSIDYLFVSLK